MLDMVRALPSRDTSHAPTERRLSSFAILELTYLVVVRAKAWRERDRKRKRHPSLLTDLDTFLEIRESIS